MNAGLFRGGTVAKFIAARNMDVLDIGVPLLSMHSPFEVLSKLDVEMAKRAFRTFYEDFIDKFGQADISRDDVKALMFPVLYSRNVLYRDGKRKVPYEKEKEQFSRVYPSLTRVIEALKRKDHTRLSILMQKRRSSLYLLKKLYRPITA